MEWGLENENHLTKVQSDVIDLSHIQKHLDGTVRISFDDSRFRSPLMIKDIQPSHPRSSHLKSVKSVSNFLEETEPIRKDKDLKLKGLKKESQVLPITQSIQLSKKKNKILQLKKIWKNL